MFGPYQHHHVRIDTSVKDYVGDIDKDKIHKIHLTNKVQ